MALSLWGKTDVEIRGTESKEEARGSNPGKREKEPNERGLLSQRGSLQSKRGLGDQRWNWAPTPGEEGLWGPPIFQGWE